MFVTPTNPKAEHVYSPRAVPAPQPNKHLMVRDDYPEVLGAEMSALNGKKYYIPRMGPEAIATWSNRVARDISSEVYQMDPLSSPSDLMSTTHGINTTYVDDAHRHEDIPQAPR